MRNWRGFARLALVLSAALACTGSAGAQLLVAVPPGEPAVEHAELAYALGDGPPVTWLSLRVARGPVAVVAALRDGARVQVGLDAWFEALETTASPHVLLPKDATDCGETPSLVHVSWPRARSRPATALDLDSSDDVMTVLKGAGLGLAGELPDAESYVVWSWPASAEAQTTRTLRIEGGAAPLTLSPGFDFPVLVSAITRGAQSYEAELDKRGLEVTFVAGSRRTSDYTKTLTAWLEARPEPILETRARGLLFDWSIYDDVLSVAPLVDAYAARAGTELSDIDAGACAEQLAALRQPDAAPALACGDATDASLALSAVASELATLQRLALFSRAGVSAERFSGGGAASSPLLRAKLLDDSACPVMKPNPPVVVVPPARGGGGDATPAPQVVEEHVTVYHEPVEVDCTGSPQPEQTDTYYYDDTDDDVDCSSDTSSTSDDSDDVDCSSDTSSTSDDSGCGSDSSSSSSDDSGVDCSSDSSSSSSDEGCSGDTTSDESGGYDGDTCSGSAAPRGQAPRAQQAALSNGPAAARRRAERPRRLKTSLWSLAFVALVLPIRRRKRGPGAAG